MSCKVKGKQRLLAIAISLSLAGYAPTTLSLGLGTAQVQSQIGEPLLAEIPILDGDSKYHANEILVRQVRGDLAKQLGFDLAADAVGYNFKIVDRKGALFLLVRSPKPMSEPFVSVLVEIEWPSGKLYRDYNLLLDFAPLPVAVPILIDSNSNKLRRTQPAENTTGNYRAASTENASAGAGRRYRAGEQSNYSAHIDSNSSSAKANGWRVGGGDTLSQIAQRIRPDDQIKLTAVVEAIFRLNPRAFANGDINQLQGGALLSLPASSDFAAMPRWDGLSNQAVVARAPSSKTLAGSVSSEPPARQALSRASQESVNETENRPFQQTSVGSINTSPQTPVVNRTKKPLRQLSKPALEPYRVRSGDTLSQVAQRLRQDPSVKLEEMMRLLFEYNPNAFADGDINQLQLGATLHVPPHGNIEAPAQLAVDDSTTGEFGTLDNSDAVNEGAVVKEQDAFDANVQRLTLSAQRAAQGSTSGSDSSAQEILSQIDAVAELVDKVNRENQSIRQRIERIEHSEQLALLERLLELQTRQIKNLRQAMLAEQASSASADNPRVLGEAEFVVSDFTDTEKGLLGDDRAIAASEAAILQQHLANPKPSPAVPTDAKSSNELPVQSIMPVADPKVGDGGESAKSQTDKVVEPSVSGGQADVQSSPAWTIFFWLVAVVSILAGWLLFARRRQSYDWLNKKLSLFEQNSDEASLPRVWDPDLGTWRIKEDIRKPVLTPLATSLPDIEKALAELENDAEVLEVTSKVDCEVKANAIADEQTSAALANQTVALEAETNPIDEMFETLPDSEIDGLVEPDEQCIPLLDEVHSAADIALATSEDESEFVLDNLDGEFEFTLPAELFDEKEPEKPASPADARVKASIIEKTKDYDSENIDEVLSGWLHSGIPTPELSEHEDVISEAMIYAAYGRHEHAEQLLLEQLVISPDEAALHSALAEVRKSNLQFKSGQGFGADVSLPTGFSLPVEPQQLGGLTLDTGDLPQAGEVKSDDDDTPDSP